MSAVNTGIQTQCLINGKWVAGQSAVDVINPANKKEVVGTAAQCSAEQVKEAIAAAEQAFKSWSTTPLEDRSDRMRKAADEIEKHIEEFVILLVRENGKTLVEAKIDLLRSVEVMRQGAEEIAGWMQPEQMDSDSTPQKIQVRRRPRGVTAIVTPWNSPMILTFKRIVPALLTGNTVVIKPATNCPLTVVSSLKVMANYFPAGVINIVTGAGRVVGDVLAEDDRIRTFAFVGGTETGKDIMSKAAGNLKKLYMELGGNDPAIVLEDAKLDDVQIDKLKSGMIKAAGQVCSGVKRVYVHESRYDELVDKLSKAFQKTVVGDGIQPGVTMGPINNGSQFTYLQGLIERVKETGAEVKTFGIELNPETWEDGYFMLPSIVLGAKQDSEIVQAEQFGPVVPILPFSTAEEVIEMANDSTFGLRASLWTENEEQAAAMADQLQAGAVFHNNHTIFLDLNVDFPGIKESGFSRETKSGSFDLFADSYGFAN